VFFPEYKTPSFTCIYNRHNCSSVYSNVDTLTQQTDRQKIVDQTVAGIAWIWFRIFVSSCWLPTNIKMYMLHTAKTKTVLLCKVCASKQ
jgi:hypothetical protein